MITVAGLSPSLDLTYLVQSYRLGEIHRPTQVVRCAGGKPLNMARAATVLGADALVVALLGGPTGAAVAAGLAHDGVSVVEVETPAETRTCVSVASADTGALTEVYEYAAPVPADVLRRFHAALAEAVGSRPGWLAICGSPPLDHASAEVAALVRIGRAAGVRVAVDTHGPALPAALAEGPDLVKINRYEAAQVLDRPTDTPLAELAARLCDLAGGSAVVLTDGGAGAVAVLAEHAYRLPAPLRQGRFPVGSGDAFLGGLLAVLDRAPATEPHWSDALRTAAAAGTANALTPGPGVIDAATVAELLAEAAGRERTSGPDG